MTCDFAKLIVRPKFMQNFSIHRIIDSNLNYVVGKTKMNSIQIMSFQFPNCYTFFYHMREQIHVQNVKMVPNNNSNDSLIPTNFLI